MMLLLNLCMTIKTDIVYIFYVYIVLQPLGITSVVTALNACCFIELG